MLERNCQITKEQCTEVMCNYLKSNNFQIKNYTQIPFKELNGYLGEHTTLKIDVDINGQLKSFTFFVKQIVQVASQRAFLDEINGAYKEAQFFNKYCKTLEMFKIKVLDDAIPKCYLANMDLIILEDLNALDYKTMESRQPLPLDCVKQGLIALSKFHASGLILQEKIKKNLNEEFAEELTEGFYQLKNITKKAFESCKHGIRALIDLTYDDSMKLKKEDFLKLAVEGIDKQAIVTKPNNRFKNTICHSDIWTKNLLFKLDENGKANHCILVDFQTSRYGPPAQDVIAYLFLVTDRQLRNTHLNYLLDFYYKELDNLLRSYGLVDYLPKGEFLENCEYFREYAIIQHITHFQVVCLSDEIIKELFADPKHAEYVTLVNKYDFIVYACGKDPVYRKKVYGAINELREFYEKKTIK